MIFEEGKNCWRKTSFKHASLVVDAGNYYEDLCATLPRATQSIYILGWDFDSRINLNRSGPESITPFSLFRKLIEKHPNLQIYLLIWGSNVYAVSRELLTRWRIPSEIKNNIHLIFDFEFPMTGSHHQKVVVIDDTLSYCGGMDITKGRWDLPSHLPNDPRRKTPEGTKFTPYHDTMIRMEGDVSKDLGDLFRERWKEATKETLTPPDSSLAIPGDDLHWDMGVAPCAISRTLAPYKDRKAITETFRAYDDLIATAKDHMYIENQYLTSAALTNMICKRLREPTGPIITIVLPKKSERGIGNKLLMLHRMVMLRRLRKADVHGRLRLCAPVVGKNLQVYVHSKLIFVDDRYALIGSSNLTDRSMGLDSECDIIIDGTQSEEVRACITRWKATLIGEHLGIAPDELLKEMTDWRTMNARITPRKDTRHLMPLPTNRLTDLQRQVVDMKIADYGNPLPMDVLADNLRTVIARPAPLWRNGIILFGTLAGLLFLVIVVVGHTPIREWLGTLLGSAEFLSIQNTRFGPLWMPLVFMVAGLLCVPMNFLMLATATVFTAPWAFLYIVSGMVLSAITNYWAGYFLGKKVLQKIFARSFEKISGAIKKKQLISFAVIRMIPVAPAGVINYIAGAYHANFTPFVIGTFLGILPGTILLVFFQRTLVSTILDPSAINITFLLLYSSILWSIALFFRRRL